MGGVHQKHQFSDALFHVSAIYTTKNRSNVHSSAKNCSKKWLTDGSCQQQSSTTDIYAWIPQHLFEAGKDMLVVFFLHQDCLKIPHVNLYNIKVANFDFFGRHFLVMTTDPEDDFHPLNFC